jgi:hypothetical protein
MAHLYKPISNYKSVPLTPSFNLYPDAELDVYWDKYAAECATSESAKQSRTSVAIYSAPSDSPLMQ